MAFNKDWANAHRVNVYTHQTLKKLAKNGLIVYSWSLLKTILGVSWDVVLDLAWPGDVIEWVSEQMRQYPIDNETTIRKELLYKPFVQDHTYKIKVIPWQTISGWDIGKYIKIDTDQYLDPATLSTTEWQFRIEGIFQSGKYAEVRILNEKDMASWIDLYITAVEDTPNIWEYEWVLSDWSRFPIDLTALIPPTSHVPAVINGNGIVTSVPSWIDNQTFQLWLNIWQLPSTDSNNQVVLWTDWKLYVAQTTIATSWFNFVNTIADRDAQTVSDWHITQVIAAIDPNDNGFYIYDSTTTSWTELIPNATVISVNGHTGVVVLIPSDLTYVATISWTPVANVQEALDAIKDFLNDFDNNVADSITNSLAVQTALENFIENTNFTLLGDITFQDNTVVFNNSEVNYNWSTINSTNTEYNHTGDTINYDATTTVEWWVFTNNTFNNATFTGNIGVGIKWVNEQIPWWPAWLFGLANIPMWDIQVSTVGWVIQIETWDYTHANDSQTFTTAIDTTGTILLVSYIIGSTAPATPSPAILYSRFRMFS